MNLRQQRALDDYKRLLNHVLAIGPDSPGFPKARDELIRRYRIAPAEVKVAMDEFAGGKINMGTGLTISLENVNDGQQD